MKLHLVTLFSLTIMPLAQAYAPPTPVKAPSVKESSELVELQVKNLNELINATQQTLANLQDLQKRIVDYATLQERYLEHTQDRELLYRMTKAAKELQTKIENDHLSHAFDSEFLDELAMLAKIYKKIGLPGP